MKIANERTFQQFDRFRQDMFRKKTNQLKKDIPNPISVKFRWVMPLALIAGGLWLIKKNMPSIKDIILDREIVTYQQWIVFEVIKKYMRCRWQQLWLNPRGKPDPNLLNQLYLLKLDSDYLHLSDKRQQKYLQLNVKTKLSFWFLNFRTE